MMRAQALTVLCGVVLVIFSKILNACGPSKLEKVVDPSSGLRGPLPKNQQNLGSGPILTVQVL